MTENRFSHPAESPYNEDGTLRQPETAGNGVDPIAQQWMRAPRPAPPAVNHSAYLQMVQAALDIASTKSLGLIATLSACGIWSWAVFDPIPTRTYAAATFSVSVLIPIILLYWKRGD